MSFQLPTPKEDIGITPVPPHNSPIVVDTLSQAITSTRRMRGFPDTPLYPIFRYMKTSRPHATSFMTGLVRKLPLIVGGRVDNRPPEAVPEADRDMVLRGLEQARNGEMATEEEVQALLTRYRL